MDGTNQCNQAIKMYSFNCRSVKRSWECVKNLCQTGDVIALQETWLLPHDLALLATVDPDFSFTCKSAVDTSAGVLRGRPYGGVAILWRKSVLPCVTVLTCNSVRLCAIKVNIGSSEILVFSVHMPTDSVESLPEFTECMSEIEAIVETNDCESVFVLGDFNAHPGELFYRELLTFCTDLNWVCVDIQLLPTDTHTYISDAHGCKRWLDHCVLSQTASSTVISAKVIYDVFLSDHFPLELTCNLGVLKPKIKRCLSFKNKVVWGERDCKQIEKFSDYCHKQLRNLDFPSELSKCCDNMCHNTEHRFIR